MSFDKRFDENGRRLKGICKTHQIHEDVVIELNSRHDGISDNAVNSVFQMVHSDRISDFYSVLEQMGDFTK